VAQLSGFAVRGGKCPLNERRGGCTSALACGGRRGWMCALARRLAWESGRVDFLFVSRVHRSKRQKPRLEKPKRDFSIRQMPSLITHTHTRRYSSLSKQIRTCTSPPRPASPVNALLLLLLNLWAKKRAPFVSCSGDVMCVCVRRSPFLFGPFFFDSVFITNGKSRPFRVSTRFSNHVCDERMALVVVVREHTASDGRCT
jgi:hypothetical protein